MDATVRAQIARLADTWTDDQLSALCGFPVKLLKFPFGLPGDASPGADVVFGIVPASAEVAVRAADAVVAAWYSLAVADDVASNPDQLVDELMAAFEALVSGWREDCLENARAAEEQIR